MGRGDYQVARWDLHEICKRARDYSWGQWVWIDGYSWAIKAFKNGNVHVRLHPEMVYRLNMVLASLYPQALAPEALAKPKRRPKSVQLAPDVISFPTLVVIRDHCKPHQTNRGTWRVEAPNWTYQAKLAGHRKTYDRVMAHLGGVEVSGGWEFDYCPNGAISDVVRTGVMPERSSHQFYPTPPTVAELVVEAAQLYEGCAVLEPSAGTGNLVAAAKRAAKGCNFVAVEAAALHVKVLEGRFRRPDCGGTVEVWHEDFLVLDCKALSGPYDRVIMNPPFSGGRARAHVEHAATVLRPGGVLVAVVPPGCVDMQIDGCEVEHVHEIPNAFDDTGITVHIIRVTRCA
jgi:predicted RNA methylase